VTAHNRAAGTPLVSVITPNFNGARHLDSTRAALQQQEVQDWEWLVVDDGSTDGSVELVAAWSASDARIHLLRAPSNAGAGPARNLGTAHSRGRYVAFLDADDVWEESKLREQLAFMEASGALFSYTSFRYMPETGGAAGVIAKVPQRMRYRDALKNTAILTSTVMIDTHGIQRSEIEFPDVRRGQDTALWWRLLRTYGPASGVQRPLTGYRQNPGSLSAHRGTALRRTWFLYREVERLSRPRAAWCFINYVWNAVRRRGGRVRVTGQ
jgi:teichuronic acid biosynthesis glycosyltransferase TuaG